ncbi:uncharacterized protein LY89DRAFT_388740 [Mollisia scopiformis]|uniref:Uncharacterized protein n=1 Tax=Mollisia scopiformis TaxID=149040 RepID=A0A194XQ86_MOLSC|nr:uncharacterized protein LY89DRAFT_388740 [Mollisia scopiformis]KUJ21907.1 hypothetical protein LY89DRAFT_388740 [Mollisia scopiformis]
MSGLFEMMLRNGKFRFVPCRLSAVGAACRVQLGCRIGRTERRRLFHPRFLIISSIALHWTGRQSAQCWRVDNTARPHWGWDGALAGPDVDRHSKREGAWEWELDLANNDRARCKKNNRSPNPNLHGGEGRGLRRVRSRITTLSVGSGGRG